MDNISTLSDKFSWRRTASIALIYKKTIKIYLCVAACTTLLCYILARLSFTLNGDISTTIIAFFSLITSVTLYLSPLTFSRDDQTLMGLLPAKAIEKWAFYTLYCIVVIPLVIEGIWYGLDYTYAFLTSSEVMNKLLLDRYHLSDFNLNFDKMTVIIGSLFLAVATIMAVLYAVIKYQRHRIVAGILALVIIMFAIGFISAISGIAMAIHILSDAPNANLNPEEIVNEMVPTFKIIFGLISVFAIYMLWLCYRRIARGDIKV